MTSRLLTVAVAAAAFGLGLGVGLGRHVESPTRADGSTAADTSLPGPDFSAIARRATPAIVNISAVQVYRSERSPVFSDPFFRDFFGRDLPFRVPRAEKRTSPGTWW